MLIYGENFKKFREALGYNQSNIAANIEITPQAIQRVEAGNGNFNDEIKAKLIEKFNLNINWLLTGNGEMFLNDKNTFELKTVEKYSKFQNFASRFNELIKKSELDIKTFSGVVDIKLERVAELSVGVKLPTINEIISLCECFNVTADWLLFGVE